MGHGPLHPDIEAHAEDAPDHVLVSVQTHTQTRRHAHARTRNEPLISLGPLHLEVEADAEDAPDHVLVSADGNDAELFVSPLFSRFVFADQFLLEKERRTE